VRTSPTEHVTTTIYDKMGQLIKKIDPTVGVTTNEFDARGWEVATNNADAATTQFSLESGAMALPRPKWRPPSISH